LLLDSEPVCASAARHLRNASTGLSLVAALAVALSTTACSVSLPADGAVMPTEQELHRQADSIDRKAFDDGLVLQDESLDRYLQTVVARLLRAAGASPDAVRVRVIRNPVLGASALAHGVIHVHTGMLALLDNEAQLATLLGHEIEHVLGKHAVREMHLQANPTMAASALNGEGEDEEASFDAIIRRFERQLEREADEAGVRRMAAAGYDTAEAPRFFEMLLADEVAAGITRDDQRGNHPAAHERLTRCQSQARALAASAAARDAVVGRHAYESAISSMLLENARMDLRMGRIDEAGAALERHLALRPDSREGRRLAAQIARIAGSQPSSFSVH